DVNRVALEAVHAARAVTAGGRRGRGDLAADAVRGRGDVARAGVGGGGSGGQGRVVLTRGGGHGRGQTPVGEEWSRADRELARGGGGEVKAAIAGVVAPVVRHVIGVVRVEVIGDVVGPGEVRIEGDGAGGAADFQLSGVIVPESVGPRDVCAGELRIGLAGV